MLKHYWFTTDTGLGYGVTAETQSLASKLLKEHGYPFPEQTIVSINEVRGYQDLELAHVAPNCVPINVRGIWFPFRNL